MRVVSAYRWLALAALMTTSGGCTIPLDLFNPALFGQLGLDPNTLRPPTGSLIVFFENNTELPVAFFAYESVNPADLTQDTRNFVVQVDPNESRNEVLECPVQLISLGTVDQEGGVGTVGATVLTDGGQMDVEYTGVALESGVTYRCGDVIAVSLNDAGGVFTLAVRILPGR